MKFEKLLLMGIVLLIMVPLASAVNVAFSCSAISATQADCTFSYTGNTAGATPPAANFDTGWAASMNVNSGSYALAQGNFQNNPAGSQVLYNSNNNPQVNMYSTSDLGQSGNFFVLRFTGLTSSTNTVTLNNIQLFDENSNTVTGIPATLSSAVTVGTTCTNVAATACATGIQCNTDGSSTVLPATGCIAGQTCQGTPATCQRTVTCTVTEPTEITCNDGIDNNCNGQVDCDDPNCNTNVCAVAGVGTGRCNFASRNCQLQGACGLAGGTCTRDCYTGSTCDASGTTCQGGSPAADGTVCVGGTCQNGACEVTCPNRANNPPTCSVCPTGEDMVELNDGSTVCSPILQEVRSAIRGTNNQLSVVSRIAQSLRNFFIQVFS